MTEERGLSFGKQQSAPTTAEFANNRAYVIGVNAYSNGIRPLRTAVADAERLGQLLAESHGYIVRSFPRDGAPALAAIRKLLHETLPQEVGPKDRVLFYFAGHGIALDGDDGPEGYLVPEDANREDRNSFLAMTELNDALASLPCRHLLLILDCCFAGAFRWSSTRDLSTLPSVIHRERYERYIQDPAWQVLTSAAYDQTALDVLSGNTIGERIETAEHSPFAAALFRALEGDADLIPRGKDGQPGGDGVITATELYLYLRECVETATVERRMRQTPGLWPLRKHDKGEYILLSPGHELNLPPAPELNYANNPYRGLQSFEEEHRQLFFGRTRIVDQLYGLVASQPLIVVLGASGTGKSSVVKAGLLPHLRGMDSEHWQILPVIRPGKSPLATLSSLALPGEDNAIGEAERLAALRLDENAFAERVRTWADAQSPGSRLVFVVDQLEELTTLCWDEREREHFIKSLAAAVDALPDRFRLILTLRSDFEPQFADCALKSNWKENRYVVPPMTTDELREAIEGPASVRVLYFQPADLVDRLIDEVIQTPGAMPLLSFTLSELYVRYLERRGNDRCLTAEDYERLGGVVGSLRSRATELYDDLDAPHQATMKRIMLRMVSTQGGELARRRVPRSELVYPKEAENQRVATIIQHLSGTRLIVEGKEADGEPYVEPAHDALVCSWDKLLAWTRDEQEQLFLRRLLTPAATDWETHQGGTWHANPRLSLLKRIQQSEESWLNATEASFVRRSVAKRTRILVSVISSVATAFVVLLIITYLAVVARNEAETNAREANRQTGNAFWQVATTARDQSQDIKAAHNFLLAAQAYNKAGDQLQRHNNELAAQFAGFEVVRSFPNDANVVGVQLSRDNSRLLVWNENGVVALWDTLTIDPPRVWKHNGPVIGAILASDHSQALSWSGSTEWDSKLPGEVRLWDVAETAPIQIWKHDHEVRGAKFSRDESRILSWGGRTSPASGEVKLCDVATSDQICSWRHQMTVNGVAFTRNESRVLSWSVDGEVKLWDVAQNILLRAWKCSSDINGVNGAAFNHDESRILVWGGTEVTLLDVTNPKPLRRWDYDGRVNGAAFSRDETRIISWSEDSTVMVLNAANSEPPKVLKHDDSVKGAMFTRDELYVLAWGAGKTGGEVRLWNVATAEPIQVWKHDGYVWGAKFCHNESRVVAWSNDGAVKLWDVNEPKPLREWNHNGYVRGAELTRDESRVLTWSNDRTVKLWDVTKAKPLHVWTHSFAVSGAAFTADESRIIAWTGRSTPSDGEVLLWNIKTNEPAQVRKHARKVIGASFTRDESCVLTWGVDGVKLWDITKPNQFPVWEVDGYADGAVFTHDESRVLVWGSGQVALWDLTQRQPQSVWQHSNVQGAVFSKDESRLLTWSDGNSIAGGRVKLWDVAKREPLQDWEHGYAVNGAVFASDESRVLAWSDDGKIKLWDVSKGEPIHIWEHDREVKGAVFNHDEQQVLAWGNDVHVKLWNVSQSKPHLIGDHALSVNGAVFTRDESHVLTWSGTSGSDRPGALKLWKVGEVEPIQVWMHQLAVKGAVFMNDESHVLAWSGSTGGGSKLSGEVKLFDVSEADPIRVWYHTPYLRGAALTKDESRIVTWNDDGTVKLLDISKTEPIKTWNQSSPVHGVLFDHDESRLLSWNADGALSIWDTALLNARLTPTERIWELEVRSATRLDSAGQLVRLTTDEWTERVRSPEYVTIQEKRGLLTEVSVPTKK